MDRKSSPTFAQIGMPFPLFEAPVADATGFEPRGNCAVCGSRDIAVFNTGGEFEVVACYACLRTGRVPCMKDTEFGFVDAEHAARGLTHGTPSPPPPALGYELVPHSGDSEDEDAPSGDAPCPTYQGEGFVMWDAGDAGERWYSVRIAREHLEELLRTPNYSTWQGEQWQFCCHRPAVFVGAWVLDDWTRAAAERGVEVPALLQEVLDLRPREAADLAEWLGGDSTVSTYVFRCSTCGKLRAHQDST